MEVEVEEMEGAAHLVLRFDRVAHGRCRRRHPLRLLLRRARLRPFGALGVRPDHDPLAQGAVVVLLQPPPDAPRMEAVLAREHAHAEVYPVVPLLCLILHPPGPTLRAAARGAALLAVAAVSSKPVHAAKANGADLATRYRVWCVLALLWTIAPSSSQD